MCVILTKKGIIVTNLTLAIGKDVTASVFFKLSDLAE